MTCPQCGAATADQEIFCAACGAKLRETDDELHARLVEREARSKLDRARKWLLIVAILTWGSGVVFYFIQRDQVEDQIRQAEQAMSGVPPEQRDALMERETGMTFDEAIAHDRGQVRLLLVVNLALGVLYFAMWWWAKRNAFAATVISLLTFVSVIAVSAVLDPKTMAQGIIVKVVFVAALISAVRAAVQARRISGRTA